MPQTDFSRLAGAAFAILLLASPAVTQLPKQTPPPEKVDRVLVLKHQHILRLLHGNQLIKEYKVALGGTPVGPKTQQGDHKTPEGKYVLDSRNLHSQYYRSLHISYPTAEQTKLARNRGVSPGGDVYIHGLPNGERMVGAAHRLRDWTDGCVAVTDEEMDEIWAAVPTGTPIEIRP